MPRETQNENSRLLEELGRYLPAGCIRAKDPVPVSGSGSFYIDAQGKEYLDFSSGIFTNSFGHGCERLNRAGYEQAGRLANIHGRHCVAELTFYRRLSAYLPAKDYKAIPYNDGGYTIDRGLSDVINHYGKQRIGIAAYRNGFHGKTQAVKLLINETRKAALYDNFQIDFPDCYRCPWKKERASCDMECEKEACRKLREKEARALIFEPVQGAGIYVPPPGYWKAMEKFCKEQGILLFADEVLTGGGRTGEYLACTHFGIVPDLIALTKGLANGKPLSVLLEREYLTKNKYASRPMERASTFAAHPEALAVAGELLLMLKEGDVLSHVKRCGKLLAEGLAELPERFLQVGDARSFGCMAAVEFVRDKTSKEPDPAFSMRVFDRCRENGLETIGGGHILRLAPPLNITKADLLRGLAILAKSIAEIQREG